MKAIVNTAPGRLEFLEWPLPTPQAGQIRIRTAAVAICATDLQMIAGWERTGFPSIPGHEWSGVVDAVGPQGDPSLIGRHCVADNVQGDGGEVGFEYAGGYGEYFLTRQANVRVLPDSLDLAAAALIEPLAVCVRGWNRLGRKAAGPTLIIGDGPIGLVTLMVMRQYGVSDITLVGGRAPRLSLAQELGAGRVLNYHNMEGDLAKAICRTCGRNFSTVVEASGSASGMPTAMGTAARGAQILVLGDYADHCATFPWNDLLHRELSLIGSCASADAWDEAVHLATHGALPLGRLVTQRLPAAQFAQGVETTRQGRGDMVKVVLEWNR